MTLITLIMLSFGLAMDAFAVSVSNGMCYNDYRLKDSFFAALCFGFFQGAMPLIGFFFGNLLGDFIVAFDHWIALLLLGFIGGKMIGDAIKERKNPEDFCLLERYTPKEMFLQAVATSIDAMAVGIQFSVMRVDITSAVMAIAVITTLCCLCGGWLGRKFGSILGSNAKLLGGAILVFIGVRIFVEHTML